MWLTGSYHHLEVGSAVRALGSNTGFAIYLLTVWPWSDHLTFQFLLKLNGKLWYFSIPSKIVTSTGDLLLPPAPPLPFLQLQSTSEYQTAGHRGLRRQDRYSFLKVLLKGEDVFLVHPFSTPPSWKEAMDESHLGSCSQGHHIKDGSTQKPPRFLKELMENTHLWTIRWERRKLFNLNHR